MRNKLFVILQYCLPQHVLSRLVGLLADSERPWLKRKLIALFSQHFDINIAEAMPADYEKYKSFNAFFTRPLKPGARIIDPASNAITSPADGAISEIGYLDADRLIQAKGQHYSLLALLGGDQALAQPFYNGAFATIYLSPKDYHRVHMPFAGKLEKTCYIPGKLFSVNQVTANHVPGLFSKNERLVCYFSTDHGPMIIILVGAMIVAGIETTWSGQVTPKSKTINSIDIKQNIALFKGQEMGRFKLGSTAIVLLPAHKAKWNTNLMNGSAVRMGQTLGEFNS